MIIKLSDFLLDGILETGNPKECPPEEESTVASPLSNLDVYELRTVLDEFNNQVNRVFTVRNTRVNGAFLYSLCKRGYLKLVEKIDVGEYEYRKNRFVKNYINAYQATPKMFNLQEDWIQDIILEEYDLPIQKNLMIMERLAQENADLSKRRDEAEKAWRKDFFRR